MLDHLGRACLSARRGAGLRQIDIATVAGVSHGAVSRFETPGGGHPRDVEALVTAYASECAVPALSLWELALQAWRTERS